MFGYLEPFLGLAKVGAMLFRIISLFFSIKVQDNTSRHGTIIQFTKPLLPNYYYKTYMYFYYNTHQRLEYEWICHIAINNFIKVCPFCDFVMKTQLCNFFFLSMMAVSGNKDGSWMKFKWQTLRNQNRGLSHAINGCHCMRVIVK